MTVGPHTVLDSSPWQTWDFGDPFGVIVKFLTVREICVLEGVCKRWHEQVMQNGLWDDQVEMNKFPRIRGKTLPSKEYVKIFYRQTLSARDIACLGEFVGKLPDISEEVFRKLSEKDPFAPEMGMGRTFRFIVEPQHIKREYEKELLDDLIRCGDFQYDAKNTPKEQGFLIPYSLKNLIVLAMHPVTGKDKVVLDTIDLSVIDQCSSVANEVNIYWMRMDMPKQSRKLSGLNQDKLMREKGLESTPLRVRALYDIVKILNTGSCPDVHSPTMTYVRPSDRVHDNQQVYRICIGGFVPGRGLDILKNDTQSPFVGAVPCLRAAVENQKQ